MVTAERAAAILAEEWCAALGVPDPATGPDFFADGGDSMLAVVLIERVERRLGIAFPLDVLFLDGTYDAVLKVCVELAAHPSGAGR
jgi:acyl carrier protein